MEKGRVGSKRRCMFKPKYSYTDNIVNNLTLIAEARTVILNAPLVPKWEVSLRRDALIHSAHASTAIEGNQLTLEEVSALAQGRDIMVRRKDKQEVINYLKALENIPAFAQKAVLSVPDLLKIQKQVTAGTLDDPKDEGAFRACRVAVVNKATKQIVFEPPAVKLVKPLTVDFLKWFDSPLALKIDPVLQAGIAHYELVRIHPFVDGNGRTARVLASLALYKRGFDVKRFFALDDYYDHDRPAYYAALKSVDKNTLDLTGWLEYFTGGVAVSIKGVKDKVMALSRDIKVLKDKGQIALTARQMKIVEFINDNGKITNKDMQAMLKVSPQAVHKEVTKLVKLGVVKTVGLGRAMHYELA